MADDSLSDDVSAGAELIVGHPVKVARLKHDDSTAVVIF